MLKRFTLVSIAALAAAWTALWPMAALAHSATAGLLAQTDASATDTEPETLTGTIHAFVIDSAVRGTSIRYVELALDDGTLVPLRGDGSGALASGTRAKVAGHRNGKALDVESAEALAAPQTTPKANAEYDGTLAVLHADDFAHGRSSFVYELHASSGEIRRLRMGFLPEALAPGMRLRVTGHAETDAASITPDHITILAEPTSALPSSGAIAKAATMNRVLVILANFNNTALPSFGPTQAQQVMTSNGDSVANFFREASYGQQLLNVTITPSWVTMNLARPASCGNNDWQGIGTSAEAAARALGAAYDSTGYDFVVYLFPTVPACGWLGLAYIGNPHKAWINA